MWRVEIEDGPSRVLHEHCALTCMIVCRGGDRLGVVSESMSVEQALYAARGVVSVSIVTEESVRCSHCERY